MKATERKGRPKKAAFLLVRTQMSYVSNETQSAFPLAAISHEPESGETKDHHGPGRGLRDSRRERPNAADAILSDILEETANRCQVHRGDLLPIDRSDIEEVLAVEVEAELLTECRRVRQLVFNVNDHAGCGEVVYVKDVSGKSKAVLKVPADLTEAIARRVKDARLARRCSARQRLVTCESNSVCRVGVGVSRQRRGVVTGDVLKQDILIDNGRVIARADDDISVGGPHRNRQNGAR